MNSYIVISQSEVGIFYFTYLRGTGEREYGERDRLPPPRRRSLPTGEPLR